MNVLITGGAGFIGSHLTDRLLKRKHKVFVIDNMSTGSVNNLPIKNKNLFFINGCIVSKDCDISKILSENKIDVVYHLAASVGVRYIWESPVECITNNIDGSMNVLRACVEHDVRVIVTSTSEVYGDSKNIVQSEDDLPSFGLPQDLRCCYAASKYIDELMALSYYHKNGLEATVIRLFNTIGPRQTDKYGMVVPRFIKQAKENKPITVYGNGEQIRTFVDVFDVVWALEMLAKNKESVGEIYNIGGVCTTSILSLAETIIRLTNSESKIEYIPYEEAFDKNFADMACRVPDISKIRKLIGFNPNRNLDDILTRIINVTT